MTDKLPADVITWCRENGYGEIRSLQAVSGGCINNVLRLGTASGKGLFLKTNSHAPPDMFECEVQGLQALDVPGGPRVPHPLVWGRSFLVMEDLSPSIRVADYWPDFGRRLAVLHNHTYPSFGFVQDNYIGSTRQPNPWTKDGFEFFNEHRLVYQARLASRATLLEKVELKAIEDLARRLAEFIPPQPASLLHGDLWSGNAITDSQGRPAIIDPAVYYGWAEAELGMTALFGSFPEAFYQGYQEIRPLEPGWQERLPLYNLYHLLNHVNLFGASYLGGVRRILMRYR